MQALVINAVGNSEIQRIADPDPGPDEVLLRVNHVGLCGSDLNTFRGLNPLASLPRIPGHEISATIAELGTNVPAEFQIGQTVIVIPYTECGKCASCRKGRTNACRYNKTLGVQQEGGLSDNLVVRHDRLIVNGSLSSRQRALVEPLAVGFHAVNRASISCSDTVVVLGAGMIGVGCAIGALELQARVLVVEVSDAKTEVLRSLGIGQVVNPRRVNLLSAINDLTDGDGADIVIEAVGHPETFRAAVDLACFGGQIVYVGYSKDEVCYDTKFFNLKELDMFGSRNATRQDFENVISYLERHPEAADALISRTFPLSEAGRALPYWESVRDKTFKVMVELEND